MTQFLILNGALDLRSNRLYAIVDQANPLPTGSAFELFYDGVDADWFDTQTDEFLRLNGLKDAPVSIVRWDGASPPLACKTPRISTISVGSKSSSMTIRGIPAFNNFATYLPIPTPVVSPTFDQRCRQRKAG